VYTDKGGDDVSYFRMTKSNNWNKFILNIYLKIKIYNILIRIEMYCRFFMKNAINYLTEDQQLTIIRCNYKNPRSSN
jgi:hypothetical protein